MYEGPLTLKCPVGGEEWPVDSFKCFVDGMKEKQTPSTITFFCPAHHCFKLKQAMAGGMLTKAHEKRLLASAEELAATYRRCNSFEDIMRMQEKYGLEPLPEDVHLLADNEEDIPEP